MPALGTVLAFSVGALAAINGDWTGPTWWHFFLVCGCYSTVWHFYHHLTRRGPGLIQQLGPVLFYWRLIYTSLLWGGVLIGGLVFGSFFWLVFRAGVAIFD